MTAVAPNRTHEFVELELLHGAVFDAEVWTLAVDAGLRLDHLSSPSAQRMFRALEAHFAASPEPPGESSVLLLRGLPPDDVQRLTTAAGSKGAAQLARAIIDDAAERERKRTVKMAEAALREGDAERARQLIDQVQHERPSAFEWHATSAIFAPLPRTPWSVEGLQIGPGRPTVIAGFGASAKTLSAQSLALSCAAGALVWGRHFTDPMRVRHIDYEQGFRATAKRYQRLAIGSAINPDELDNRLQLCVFPSVFLDSPGAADAYSRACDGADLVIIDALRGATPTQDENDSSIRQCIDHLTLVSERTGAAFIVLHHAGKPKDAHSDARTVARGSSAIFDAAGCMLLISNGKASTDPRRVVQTKSPAEAAGGIEPFELAIEDVAIGSDQSAGVRVLWKAPEVEDSQAKADEAFERDAARLLAVIRDQPGCTHNTIVATAGMNRQRVGDVLAALADIGRVACLPGPRGSKTYRVDA